jgi:hypothetical protein
MVEGGWTGGHRQNVIYSVSRENNRMEINKNKTIILLCEFSDT